VLAGAEAGGVEYGDSAPVMTGVLSPGATACCFPGALH
jgi:hypothetical protein